jgi:flagellar protein FlgJ
MEAQWQSVKNYNDFSGFAELKSMAHNKEDKALEEVAKQFEGVFLQMLMKSMRDASAVLSKDNFLHSETTSFYEGMQDQQMAVHLGQNKQLGLADMIVRQLKPMVSVTPETTNPSPPPLIAEQTRQLTLEPRTPKPTTVPLRQIDAQGSETAKFDNPHDFIRSIWPMAVKIAGEHNFDPKLLVAQAALETGWGKGILQDHEGKSSYNLFNIKANSAWKQDKVTVNTLEYNGGIPQKAKADFRQYNSFSDSMHDYFNFINSNPRYQEAVSTFKNPTDYISKISEAGYATDPNYADKILKIYHGNLFKQAGVE